MTEHGFVMQYEDEIDDVVLLSMERVLRRNFAQAQKVTPELEGVEPHIFGWVSEATGFYQGGWFYDTEDPEHVLTELPK